MYIARSTAKAAKYYLKNITKLQQQDYIAITYEEFCLHPQRTVEAIMQKLKLSMTTPFDAAALLNPRVVDIDTTVQKFLPYISRTMKNYCAMFNYKI